MSKKLINTEFNFVSKFKLFSILSCILVVVSLIAFFTKGQYGVDFRGGSEVQIKFEKEINMGELRSVLSHLESEVSSVQSIGDDFDHEYLIKIAANKKQMANLSESVSTLLKKKFPDSGSEVRKVDIVGPKAGKRLRASGFQAMLWAFLSILIYVGLRFDFKYAPGAIIATIHDVSIILGLYAFTGREFSLQTVAAVLAVIGYSVNDTVIVYDRVREHENKFKSVDLKVHINRALNDVLSRTIITSGTTLFVALSMFFFGGEAISDFFFAIVAGVVIGTYSSIYIAAPVTLVFNHFLKKKEVTKI